MKNKKLLTRLFALLASLVLVLALALPCFADETEPPPTDYTYIRVYSFEDLQILLNTTSQSVPIIIRETAYSSKLGYTDIYYSNYDNYYAISFDSVSLVDVINISLLITSDLVTLEYFVYEDGRLTENETLDISWSDVELYILVPISEEDIIVEHGWYGQIKNIIKDAVFGTDTVLNDSQEFTLNQIALWLSLIVILLPFVIVAVIVVRCFR